MSTDKLTSKKAALILIDDLYVMLSDIRSAAEDINDVGEEADYIFDLAIALDAQLVRIYDFIEQPRR